ncbi:MAG: PEP-CTERM sorting domain-containing protein [Phycisphaerae bacterium]|nr:PEP-CTERM sorting domain-containing protein [Phycisphaerae bacterium]
MVVLALVALPLQAAFVGQESFSYSEGLLDGQNGGTGFSDAWATENTYVTSGGEAAQYSAYGAGAATRTIADPMRYDQDGTYYMSIKINKQVTGNSGGDYAVAEVWSQSVGTTYLSFGVGSDESYYLGFIDNDTYSANTSAGDYTGGDVYLVAKVVTYSGSTSDEAYLKIYTSGIDATEPTSWDLQVSGSSGAIDVQNLLLKSGVNNDARFDDLYFGTSFSDVVPEPATISLLATGLFWGILRKR